MKNPARTSTVILYVNEALARGGALSWVGEVVHNPEELADLYDKLVEAEREAWAADDASYDGLADGDFCRLRTPGCDCDTWPEADEVDHPDLASWESVAQALHDLGQIANENDNRELLANVLHAARSNADRERRHGNYTGATEFERIRTDLLGIPATMW